MDTKGYRHIPSAVFDAITFLAQVLPKRSIPTFLELLVGAMLTHTGFVTDALLAIESCKHWTNYYKWLHVGKWSWVALGQQTLRLVVRMVPRQTWFAVIDDTIVLRSSTKAPGSAIHHQHGSKANRPQYVRGQCWVTLALALPKGFRSLAIPLLSRLARTGENAGKLVAAKTLLRVISPLLQGLESYLLLDSWYMRHILISYALSQGLQVIGQVRKDTALFHLPSDSTGKRGRPRKYGPKVSQDWIQSLPESRITCPLYGKTQTVCYRSTILLARFLKARAVRIVWSQFLQDDGTLSRIHVLLSTDTSLSGARIILHYARRWSIEDVFNQLKNRWGWKETWQQTRQVLHRWVQILSISYAIPQLLAFLGGSQVEALISSLSPWRRNQPTTAGRVRQGLQKILGHVNICALWHPKSGKFGRQHRGLEDESPPQIDKAA